MAIVKYAGEEAVNAIAEHVNQKLRIVSSMPVSPEENDTVLYVGADSGSYLSGGIYKSEKPDNIFAVKVEENFLDDNPWFVREDVGDQHRYTPISGHNVYEYVYSHDTTIETTDHKPQCKYRVEYIVSNDESLYILKYVDIEDNTDHYQGLTGSGQPEDLDLFLVFGVDKPFSEIPNNTNILSLSDGCLDDNPWFIKEYNENGYDYVIKDDASIYFYITQVNAGEWYKLKNKLSYNNTTDTFTISFESNASYDGISEFYFSLANLNDISKWSLINDAASVELTSDEYNALPESVQKNGRIYFVTDAGGSSTGGGVVFGYYNETTGKFYKDAGYETEIAPTENVLYVELTTKLIYRYDSANTGYVPLTGSAATKGFTTNVEPNNHNLVESNAVYAAISRSIASVYVPHGDLTCAELVSSLLVAANVGNLYNMTDSGTSTADFIGGAGQAINVGDTVGIVQTGPDVYKFNLMPGLLDLHDYYSIGDEATTDIADGDYFPMYDTSVSGKKKTLWSTIVEKILTKIGAVTGIGTANGVRLTTTDDLNDVYLNGFYSIKSSQLPANTPSGYSADFSMVVISMNDVEVKQILHCTSSNYVGATFERTAYWVSPGTSRVWTAWKRTDVLDSFNYTSERPISHKGIYDRIRGLNVKYYDEAISVNGSKTFEFPYYWRTYLIISTYHQSQGMWMVTCVGGTVMKIYSSTSNLSITTTNDQANNKCYITATVSGGTAARITIIDAGGS